MTPSTDIIPASCPELGIEVPVATIERELHKLWENDDARTHASLMNLVVYSEKNGALLENSAIIRELMREHACRAILVEIDPYEPKPSLRAWVTAHCYLSDGRKSVCCEQIAFHLTGRVTGRFRNTVFAHLSSDLPLVFWWQGELSGTLTERLVSVIDRLIIDSSCWENPRESFKCIEEVSKTNSRLIVQDHAWTRSWQFRVGIASLFDDSIAQDAFDEISHIEIVYHPSHRNTALQILAWLVVQAEWTEDQACESFSFISKHKRNITANLVVMADGPPLSSVTILAGLTVVKVSQALGENHVERQVVTPGYKATSLSPCDPISAAELIGVQLSRGGKNSLFQKILPLFRSFLAK